MRDSLFRKDFTVAKDSNRMGIRLTNPGMERLEFPEMVSSGVSPGTIQMAHDGTLLLLMADAQTTGGYPRIAHVAGADIARCAQLRPGDTVRFIETSLLEAELALLQSWRDLRILSHAIREAFERED
jgi:antagonist of KipI